MLEMIMASEITKIIDKYQLVREKKLPRIQKFWQNDLKVPFLVVQQEPSAFYVKCHSIEDSFEENIIGFNKNLDVASDHIPYLEPWFGTGVYANAFGCKYFWRDNEAPATHYKYHSIYEVKDIEKPSINDSDIMRMVLDAIKYYKNRTSGMLPISLTDTQSSFDTATLILDASELFTACYTEPEIVMDFMNCINDLIIEFSKIQLELIGDVATRPGHIMVSDPAFSGISISDDNLAVSSPKINEIFALPVDQKLADTFGGLAIHSCGNWSETMKLLTKMKNVLMIDCAISTSGDPNPNKPEDVRDALRNSPIMLKARIGKNLNEISDVLDKLFDPTIRLIVEVCGASGDRDEQEKLYHYVSEKINSLYKKI